MKSLRLAFALATLALSAKEAAPQASDAPGEVYIWGADLFVKGKDGRPERRARPLKVQGLTSITAVSGGEDHGLALAQDGTVWAWGNNDFGQLGDGTTTARIIPVQVPGLKDVTSVSAGNQFSVVLKRDGSVWAWGHNGVGQLGDGTKADRLTPIRVPGLTGVVAVSARHQNVLALKKDGSVWGWGNNSSGQAGGGGGPDVAASPIQVQGLSEIQAVAAGGHFCVALKKDGSVWVWGAGRVSGATRRPDEGHSLPPTPVPALREITTIAAGYQSFLALKKDGSVWGWGTWTFFGEEQRRDPEPIGGLKDVTDIAEGFLHALVLKKDGTVWAWGWNNLGQLGDGTLTDKHVPAEGGQAAPVQVAGLVGIRAIAGGSATSLAVH